MQIDWWTLLLQAINFLVLVWLLWRFLYRPVREVVEKRKQLAEQALGEADKRREEAEAARLQYEADRAHLAEERQRLLKQAHADLEKERQAALAQARQQAATMLEEARQAIAKERSAALTAIREDVAETAAQLAGQILQQTAGGKPGPALIEQLIKRLNALPDDERERLQSDLSADGGRLEVVTAGALSEDEKTLWRDRLKACLGRQGSLKFTVDPAVLGGAALHFPHAALSLTWADQIAKARDLLSRAAEAPSKAGGKAEDRNEAAS